MKTLFSSIAILATASLLSLSTQASSITVHTLCTYAARPVSYFVQVKTLNALGDWKAKIDVVTMDENGLSQFLASRGVTFMQHTMSESYTAEGVRLVIAYVDPTRTYPTGEKGTLDMQLGEGSSLHLEGMNCTHITE